MGKKLTYKTTETGCHEPTSHKSDDGHGYPVFIKKGKRHRIYRYQFEKRYGPVQKGLLVRHTCDNRKCINTDHMLLGTRADNMHDRTARNRTSKGETNGKSKIMEEDALFILRSTQTNKQLAKKFSISESAVSYIRSGRRWKHLHNPVTV